MRIIAVRKPRGVLAVLMIASLCLPAALLMVSLVKPVFMPRYLLWSAAPFFICAGLGVTLLPRLLQWPALAIFGLLLAVNLLPYYHDETKARWDLAAAQLAGFRQGDLILVGDPPVSNMISFFLKREAIDLPMSMCTTDVERALRWRNEGNRVWALQGLTGTPIYSTQTQFLRRIAILGAPQFSAHAGSDILLLRFDGKAGQENLSMNIDTGSVSRPLQ